MMDTFLQNFIQYFQNLSVLFPFDLALHDRWHHSTLSITFFKCRFRGGFWFLSFWSLVIILLRKCPVASLLLIDQIMRDPEFMKIFYDWSVTSIELFCWFLCLGFSSNTICRWSILTELSYPDQEKNFQIEIS